jgi:hypothetical protein
VLVHGVLSLEQRLGSTNDVGVHSSVAAVTVGIRLVIDATKVSIQFPSHYGDERKRRIGELCTGCRRYWRGGRPAAWAAGPRTAAAGGRPQGRP